MTQVHISAGDIDQSIFSKECAGCDRFGLLWTFSLRLLPIANQRMPIASVDCRFEPCGAVWSRVEPSGAFGEVGKLFESFGFVWKSLELSGACGAFLSLQERARDARMLHGTSGDARRSREAPGDATRR